MDQVGVRTTTVLVITATPELAAEAATRAMARNRTLVVRNSGRVAREDDRRLVAEFGSTTDAVDAAAEVSQFAADEAGDGPTALSLGIHVGEVRTQADGVAGDAVDIAARLAEAAPPGELFVTRTALAALRKEDRAAFAQVPQAELAAAGVASEVFRVAGPAAERPSAMKRSMVIMLSALIAFLLVGGYTAWRLSTR